MGGCGSAPLTGDDSPLSSLSFINYARKSRCVLAVASSLVHMRDWACAHTWLQRAASVGLALVP